jgi:hypothetical protein
VDAAAPGKREADERSRAEIEMVSVVLMFPPSVQVIAKPD